MRRWAQVSGDTIVTVVEQTSTPAIAGQWVELVGQFGPGDAVVGGKAYRAGSPELAEAINARNAQQGN